MNFSPKTIFSIATQNNYRLSVFALIFRAPALSEAKENTFRPSFIGNVEGIAIMTLPIFIFSDGKYFPKYSRLCVGL